MKHSTLTLNPETLIDSFHLLRDSENEVLQELVSLITNYDPWELKQILKRTLPDILMETPVELYYGMQDNTAYTQFNANGELSFQGTVLTHGDETDFKMGLLIEGWQIDIHSETDPYKVNLTLTGNNDTSSFTLQFTDQHTNSSPHSAQLIFDGDDCHVTVDFGLSEEADGSSSSKVTVSAKYADKETESLSFRILEFNTPFDDVFSGKQMTTLTADTASDAFHQLKWDAFLWVLDAGILLLDRGVRILAWTVCKALL